MAFDLDWSTLIISLGIAIPLLIVTIVITIVIVCVCKRKRSTPKRKRLDFVKVHCMSLYFAVCLFFSFFNFCPHGRLVDEIFIETYLSVWQFYYLLFTINFKLIASHVYVCFVCSGSKRESDNSFPDTGEKDFQKEHCAIDSYQGKYCSDPYKVSFEIENVNNYTLKGI